MTTDEAIELVAEDMSSRRPDWSTQTCREMVEQARRSIDANPQKFVDSYLANVRVLEKNRGAK